MENKNISTICTRCSSNYGKPYYVTVGKYITHLCYSCGVMLKVPNEIVIELPEHSKEFSK